MSTYNVTFKYSIPLLTVSLLAASSTAQAGWSGGGDFSAYYTDDVGLFSVTRRLSLEQDPTQPAVDEPGQGSDFIYDPRAYISWDTENQLGEFAVSLDAGGYIFQDHSDYSHAFFQLAVEQNMTEETKLKLFYDFIPSLFIGQKSLSTAHSETEEHHEAEADERLNSHVWSMHVEHELTETLILRGLARYGIRSYNQPFSHRDTQFFTIGPHLEWIISPSVELLVGYHFERGYTDQEKVVHYQDDIGYINHFASAELKVRLLPELTLNLIFDYEHNDFTSPYVYDIHHNGNENVYQGELELLYEVTESTTLKAGWQHGARKFNYEAHTVHNNNGWIGIEYHF